MNAAGDMVNDEASGHTSPKSENSIRYIQNLRLRRCCKVKLYKYKNLDSSLFRNLMSGEVYGSQPSKFNDPLDCNPEILNDAATRDLEQCLYLLEGRSATTKEDKENARNRFREGIERDRFYATEHGSFDDGAEGESYYRLRLETRVKELFFQIFASCGVYCLASSWNSPLMWSHYAQAHTGVCLEFDFSQISGERPLKVDYERRRVIKCSDILAWLRSRGGPQEAILYTTLTAQFFLTKLRCWRYEKERRYIWEHSGLRMLPAPISAIYFGMKCDEWLQAAVIRVMGSAASHRRYYRVFARQDDGQLDRRDLGADIPEIEQCLPREYFEIPPFTDEDLDRLKIQWPSEIAED